MINKHLLIQNQNLRATDSSNEVTVTAIKSIRSLEPVSPGDIERNLGSNLQNYDSK